MSRILISPNPIIERDFVDSKTDVLRVSEFFYDTIQGEGVNIGYPAAFLRLQGCTLDCSYCDTKAIWKHGNLYTFGELFYLMEVRLIDKLREGQHLVLTGGSPLMQQNNLIDFIKNFIEKYSFKPYIEIENECVLRPTWELFQLIDCWNNSPKLPSSGNPVLNKNLIKILSALDNSWFKFVITCESDWDEIQMRFLKPKIIKKSQVILMPEGANLQELEQNRQLVVDIAIKNNVRYCTREHVVLYGNQTGI